MECDENAIIDGLQERMSIKKLLELLISLDKVITETGYGSVEIQIADRRVSFINSTIRNDVRSL